MPIIRMKSFFANDFFSGRISFSGSSRLQTTYFFIVLTLKLETKNDKKHFAENTKYRFSLLWSEAEAQATIEPQTTQVNLDVIRLDLQAAIFYFS